MRRSSKISIFLSISFSLKRSINFISSVSLYSNLPLPFGLLINFSLAWALMCNVDVSQTIALFTLMLIVNGIVDLNAFAPIAFMVSCQSKKRNTKACWIFLRLLPFEVSMSNSMNVPLFSIVNFVFFMIYIFKLFCYLWSDTTDCTPWSNIEWHR